VAVALITGINGFTGRYLAAELQAHGHTVYGIDPVLPTPPPDNVYGYDLLDRSGLGEIVETIRPDYVAHLAAISFVAHGNADAIYRINIVGTRNLLDALASCTHRPKTVLLASSANIYGNTEIEPIDENVPPAPANDYGVSKLAMEYMARLWSDQLPLTFVRPFNYTGVGQTENFLLSKIVAHFRRRDAVLELGNLDVSRDFSDVRMVARWYRQLLELGGAGEIFNTCSGIGHSLQEVLAMMRSISGFSPEIRVNPAFVRANEVRRLVGSRAKLDRAIGTTEMIPLFETLRWMYESVE
jgi:nucleoside-diphosphate-sugar epimerase